MKILYKGGLACTINLYQWPGNCGYLIISSIGANWEWPSNVIEDGKFVDFVVDAVSSYYPSYQAVLFSTHETSTSRKLQMSALSDVTTIHSGVTKYSSDAKVELHMWNPSKVGVKSLRDVEKKWGLAEGNLSYNTSEYERAMLKGNADYIKAGPLREVNK